MRKCKVESYFLVYTIRVNFLGIAVLNSNFSPVIGCSKFKIQACKPNLPIRSISEPYFLSPIIGKPKSFKCTLIWFLRPVSSQTLSRVYSLLPFKTL